MGCASLHPPLLGAHLNLPLVAPENGSISFGSSNLFPVLRPPEYTPAADKELGLQCESSWIDASCTTFSQQGHIRICNRGRGRHREMQTRRKAQDAGIKRESVKPKRATKKRRLLSSAAQEKPKARGQHKMESPPARPRKSVAQSSRKTRSKNGPSVVDEKSVPQASQLAKGRESEMKEIEDKIRINRAPVLTMWVGVVAKREGFTYEEGLSFGKAIAGLMAQSKGRRLGLYEEPSEEKKEERKRKRKELDRFCVFGMNVPGKTTEGGLRLALQSGKPIWPASVESYLHRSFGANHERVKGAMEDLANSFPSEEIGKAAYPLYEKFRPAVPYGMKGWGAKGFLDVESMLALRKQ